MSDVVNLRLARKAKKRTADQKSAEENRVRHGRTKAEKQLDSFNTEQEQRRHTGRRLPDSPDDDTSKNDKP